MTSEVQHTIARRASLSGISLHTGENVVVTCSAPVGSGIKFKRVDLKDEPTIDARVENVKSSERSTTIAEGHVKVHTVEHVLSALSAFGVDNVVIEMDANEPAIGDGSARLYVDLIKEAGVVAQDARRQVFEISEPFHMETNAGSILTVVPDEKLRISCTQVGPDGRFTQFYSTEITPEIYEREIAPARTFVFYEDVKPLMDKGLIKGGSLDNALVIRGESVLGKEPLRFPNEFARHKILDILGDLALLGHGLRGHVIAVKPGHAANTDLARSLSKKYAQLMSMVPAAMIPKGGSVLDVNDVMKILPHRFPFLMVDRIVAFEGDTKCTGIKSVSINEPYFQGHFPGHPVMPGVLQLEAMAQVASVAFLRQGGNAGRIGYFMSADSVKFRKTVVPGDTLFIHVEVLKTKKNVAKVSGKCIVNGELVSEAELMFGLLLG